MKGVLDRIEDGIAVILVEEKGDEFTVKEDDLPVDSKEGTWFQLDVNDSGYTILAIDENMTNKANETSALYLKKLQLKKRKSKFKRN
ncbi:DUF3006 domain-containing protein [Pseudogracilibacillus sp. SO30301A]|uniref:DUF3006 domain-containing protein n=1 Tax=Pseudogracilibacillus sp. SO30301A TaxID=3098291 RepID=UPI00300E43D6